MTKKRKGWVKVKTAAEAAAELHKNDGKPQAGPLITDEVYGFLGPLI